MYRVGITGSIGTGKSTIASMFALFNIPIFDADKKIKKILNNDDIKFQLKKTWPSIIKSNNIDKSKLKTIIFSNENERKKLEDLLYPQLEKEKSSFEESNFNREILVYDVPLIYETNTQKNYDLILLAYCDPNLQKKRVLSRDKISESLFEKIIKSQLNIKEKIKFKPKIINTNRFKIFILVKVILVLIEILIMLKVKSKK